jgi:hypothetical protein
MVAIARIVFIPALREPSRRFEIWAVEIPPFLAMSA